MNIRIIGLKELQQKFDKLPAALQIEVRAIVENGAKTFVRLAKKDAVSSVDFGFLRNGITYASGLGDKTRTTFEVISNARYSAYIEWGTITRVEVPVELVAYAMEFKGKGIRKNGGIYPKPFFFKQITPVKLQIERAIKDIKL